MASGKLRVAVIADYLEEGWPSMDLVADMLFDRLQREHASAIEPTLVRPAMRRRAGRLPGGLRSPWMPTLDRVANRLWDYPRAMAGFDGRFDLFHIVDHSYAQLVHRLPAERTIVTCHDLDTFRSVLDPRARTPIAAVPRDDATHSRRVCARPVTSPATATPRATRSSPRRTFRWRGRPSCRTGRTRAARRLRSQPRTWRRRGCSARGGIRGAAARRQHHRSQAHRRAARRLQGGARHAPARGQRWRRESPLVSVGGPFTAAQQAMAQGPRAQRRDRRAADSRSRDARRRVSAQRAAPDAVGARRVRPAGARGAGVRHAGGRERRRLRCARSADSRPPIVRSRTWTPGMRPSCACCGERRDNRAQWTMRSETGIRRAAAFSWSRYASDVVAIYARMIDRPGPAWASARWSRAEGPARREVLPARAGRDGARRALAVHRDAGPVGQPGAGVQRRFEHDR